MSLRIPLLSAALACVTILGCGGSGGSGSATSGPPTGAPPVEAIAAAEASARVASGAAILVDVREAGELAGGMAEPAIWMPMSSVGGDAWTQFVSGVPKDRQVIFYCAVGARSQQAALRLSSAGYRTANMGGFDAWVQAGLPVKTPASPEIGK